MNIQTQDQFKTFKETFWNGITSTPMWAIGRTFIDPYTKEKIATRWVKINPTNEGSGSLAALLDFFSIKANGLKEKSLLIHYSSKDCEEILARYFSSYKKEVFGLKHQNIQAIQGGTTWSNGEDSILSIIVYGKNSMQETPVNHHDVLCRLTAISKLMFKPNTINLENVFGLLPNLAYTTNGALTPKGYEIAMLSGEVPSVLAFDKFPPILWGASLPADVRVADPSRIRLGAYLGNGTTVMHEGFVNFNAGTKGPNMVEGRISAKVFVEGNTDIGGGASIMGTLSGGGKQVISLGENCLMGANSGLGISLGNRCTVEAGTYVTASKKIYVADKRFGAIGRLIKASDLSGKDNMLFIQNSTNGRIELRFNENPIRLNKSLH